MSKALQWVITGGLLAVLVLPLYVANPLFFPFITGKNFAFRIIIEIVFASWLGLQLLSSEHRPKRSWVFASLSALVIISSLASIFGVNSHRSFWSNYERMDGLITLLHMAAYFLVLISVFKTETMWRWFWNISMAVAALVAFYGIAQLTGVTSINQSGVRLDATFGNATYLAAYMLLHCFLALFYLVQSKDTQLKIVYGVFAALYFFVMYNTATRGALLGLVFGVLLAAALIVWRSTGRVRRYAMIAGAAVIVIGVTFFAVRKTDFVRESPVMARLASLFSVENLDSKSQPRFIIWKMSLRGALERPILGWGFENYNIVFNKHFDPRLWNQETWFDRSHNTPLDWLVMTGFFGLAAYLSLFASAIWLMWKNSNLEVPEKAMLTGLLAAYFVQNLFVFDNLGTYIVFFALLAYIHFRSGHSPYLDSKLDFGLPANLVKTLKDFRSSIASVLVIILAFTIYFANVKPIMANRLLIKSLYPRAVSEEGLERLRRLFALNSFGTMEAREQLLLMLTEFKRARPENLDETTYVQYLELASAEMLEQLKRSGNDARHQLFAGSFLHTFGQTDKAVLLLENAMGLSRRKQLIGMSLSRAYIDLGRTEEAYRLVKQMFEFEPKYDRARHEYAAVAIMAGHTEDAERVLVEKYGTALVPEGSIIQAYAKVNKLDKVVDIWLEQIKRNPSDPQGYVSLAATYYQMGKDSLAISTLKKLASVNPAAKETAEHYIEEIRSNKLPRK